MQEDEHCEMTKAIFGKEYREIHQWIDFTYETHQGFSHWIDTHHLEAIESKYDKDTIELSILGDESYPLR